MIETTRDKLHEEVWAEPMTKVSLRYGISDVALKKICDKHRIPTPPRGYWARREAGKKDKKTIYRPVSDPTLNRIVIQGMGRGLHPEEQIERKTRAKEKKQEVEQAISKGVPEGSNERHSAAERFHARMTKKRPDHRGFVTNRIKSGFRVDITPDSVERMTDFLSTFARTVGTAGHSLEKSDDGLLLRWDGEDLSFELFEKTDRRPHELTPKEEVALEKYEQYQKRQEKRTIYDRWDYSDYVSKPRIAEFDYIPNGQLGFRYTDGSYDGLRRTYSDGKTQTIESLLTDILAGAAGLADQKKKDREAARIRKLEREEEEKVARAQRRLKNLEKARVKSLDDLMAQWQKATDVRGFIEAVRMRATQSDRPEIADEWIEWAAGYAERLDPLAEGVPKLAEMEDFSSWELNRDPFYDR